MGTCCEYNRNNVDEGNLRGKIQYLNQITREDRIKSQNRETNITNSINDNLIENLDYHRINNEKDQKDFDNKIPLNPPKIPNDRIPDSIINSRKKLKLKIVQSKYLSEGREFIINAGGLIGSPRNNKDGITIFGDSGVIIFILIFNILIVLIVEQFNKRF